MKINFFGDFVSPSVKNLKIDEQVKKIIADGDINAINFEVPCPRNPKSCKKLDKTGPVLYQCTEAPQWIEENGWNVVSLSNNHTMDCWDEGFQDTVDAFKKAKIVGAGSWDEAYRPLFLEVEGKKISIIALTHCEFGTLSDKYDNRYKNGCAWINHPDVDKLITETKKKTDFCFIFAHAGVENIEQPLPEWRERYRAMIDLGADGVIASHPHIQQGWEMYNDKPIVYSLGNFYFPNENKKNDPRWKCSNCATLEVKQGGGVDLKIKTLVFENDMICVDESEETKLYIERINDVLADGEKYMNYINRTCVKMLDTYYFLFRVGGLCECSSLKKLLKETIKMILLRAVKSNPVYLINNLWCESHRWCICRGLKLKYEIR